MPYEMTKNTASIGSTTPVDSNDYMVEGSVNQAIIGGGVSYDTYVVNEMTNDSVEDQGYMQATIPAGGGWYIPLNFVSAVAAPSPSAVSIYDPMDDTTSYKDSYWWERSYARFYGGVNSLHYGNSMIWQNAANKSGIVHNSTWKLVLGKGSGVNPYFPLAVLTCNGSGVAKDSSHWQNASVSITYDNWILRNCAAYGPSPKYLTFSPYCYQIPSWGPIILMSDGANNVVVQKFVWSAYANEYQPSGSYYRMSLYDSRLIVSYKLPLGPSPAERWVAMAAPRLEGINPLIKNQGTITNNIETDVRFGGGGGGLPYSGNLIEEDNVDFLTLLGGMGDGSKSILPGIAAAYSKTFLFNVGRRKGYGIAYYTMTGCLWDPSLVDYDTAFVLARRYPYHLGSATSGSLTSSHETDGPAEEILSLEWKLYGDYPVRQSHWAAIRNGIQATCSSGASGVSYHVSDYPMA